MEQKTDIRSFGGNMNKEELIAELCDRFGYNSDQFDDWTIEDLEEELDMCESFEEDDNEDYED